MKILKRVVSVCLLILIIGLFSVRSSNKVSVAITDGVNYASSTEEVVNILKEARANLIEELKISVDPSVVPIENEIPNRADLHSSIYNQFHYGYVGGLYTSLEYNIGSGPSLRKNLTVQDSDNPSNMIYTIKFQYRDNVERLREADAKIRTIMSSFFGQSDGEKVISFVKWMKDNLPAGKLSESGYYTTSQGGIHGALFGDGTGFSCSTYASLIQRTLELEGIESYILGGAYKLGDVSHAFNVVKIDSLWYVLDYTTLDYQRGYILLGRDDFERQSTKNSLVNKYMPNYNFAQKNYGDVEPAATPTPTVVPEDPDNQTIETPDGSSLTVPDVFIKSLRNNKKRSMLVKWEKSSDVTGYEIEYSTNTGFSSSKKRIIDGSSTSVEIKNLKKGKLYYVRIRAYVKNDSGITYGNWGATKKVRIKK